MAALSPLYHSTVPVWGQSVTSTACQKPTSGLGSFERWNSLGNRSLAGRPVVLRRSKPRKAVCLTISAASKAHVLQEGHSKGFTWTATPVKKSVAGQLPFASLQGALAGGPAQAAEANAESTDSHALSAVMEKHAKLLDEQQAELRQAQAYLERVGSQIQWIKRRLAKKLGWTGYMKNTPLNPAKQGRDITYAQFRDLLEQEKVQYMDYDEWGKEVSVVLPHYVAQPVEGNNETPVADFVIEYQKHKVKAMPNEQWEELWQKLRTQVVDMRVDENRPTPADVVVWRQGLLAASAFVLIAFLYWAGYLLVPGIVELWDYWKIQRAIQLKAAQEGMLRKVLGEERFQKWQAEQVAIEREEADIREREFQEFEDWKDMAWKKMQERDARPAKNKAETDAKYEQLAAKFAEREASFKLPRLPWQKKDENEQQKPKREYNILDILGESRARLVTGTRTTGVTFADVAGLEYVKRELKEVVDILKDNDKYAQVGVYCPKGVLLHGPPGTGKTLLAKAVAGEAGVPFLSCAGSEFVEMFQGVAASRVRDLFRRARQLAPCIIFIDEIDAIGIARGAKGTGGEEREQALAQLLVEMDGFKAYDDRVLVMGATNRKDLLDPALLRKGRFDKVYAIRNPNRRARLAILKVHARTKPWKNEEDRDRVLEKLTDLTPNYSGAQLQNVLNEASILTVRKDKDFIEMEEILEVYEKLTEGIEVEKEVDDVGESTLRIAYREAAVSLIYTVLPDPKQAVERTFLSVEGPYPNVKFERKMEWPYTVKSEYVDMIVRGYAPRCAEEIVFGRENVTSATQAWVNASAKLAESLTCQLGMTALGITHYETHGEILPNVAPKVVALREEYMRYGYEKCTALLQEHRPALERIVESLLAKTEITGAEVRAIVESAPKIAQPPVGGVNELEALMYAGRWGIHGVSLPGRTTFSPGNVGYATFGAPRPRQVRVLDDDMIEVLNRNQARGEQARLEDEAAGGDAVRRRDLETPMEVLALT